MSVPGRWADLRTRLTSAAVMVAVGALLIWLGGLAFFGLVTALTSVMIWELAVVTAPAERRMPLVLAAVAALALLVAARSDQALAASFLLVPALGLAMTPRRDRRLAAGYGAAILVAGFGLVSLRTGGEAAILWLVAVVVVSDVAGYFAGRTIGGPKFWPAISPKKTWAGTAAGWTGAAVVGLVFVLAGTAGWGLVVLSPLVALAGQMGDIAESWIKRRAGVKDASHLIPGHGGVLDRFDAMTGAVVAVMVLGLLVPLPLPVSGPVGG